MRYKVQLSIGVLLFSTHAFANPFRESVNEKVKLSQSCLYSEVYNVSSKTYWVLNVVERLAHQSDRLETDASAALGSAVSEVQKDCAMSKAVKFSSLTFKSQVLKFEYETGVHSIEWIAKDDGEYIVYKKLYGTYKDEPLMVIKLKNNKKVFTRVTGRLGAENNSTRYTLFYDGDSTKSSSQTVLEDQRSKDLRSLKSIYGTVTAPTPAQIQVGIIGTGIDYNQPGMAKYLAYRFEMEDDLQKKELLQNQLRLSPFVSGAEYQRLMKSFETLKKNVGFPVWMDQALGTKQPQDLILVNSKRVAGRSGEHETRVSSRIIRSGGPVELHFARRTMGSLDILNVQDVMDKFVEKGVRIVNLSFGSKCDTLPLEEKMWDEAFAKYPKVVFVVSAGNSGLNSSSTPFCPAVFSQKYKNVISVTALDDHGELASYFGTSVNFGKEIDLAIKSDNLRVLVPYRKNLKWENNPIGATSLAAAEVSRILTEAILEGLEWEAQTVKKLFVETSSYRASLYGVNKHSSEVDELAFKAALKKQQDL